MKQLILQSFHSIIVRNWPDCIAEAKRRLATNGYLLVANTTKSLSKRLSKIKEVIDTKGFEIHMKKFIEACEI